MKFVDRSLLALLALLVAAPSVRAAKCSDTSRFSAVMEAVERAVPCASATKHKKYVKDAKHAIGSMLSGPCKKAFVSRFLVKSICGRRNVEVCCDANKRGKDISKIVKKGKCRKGEVCTTSPQSVGEGCTASGACATTTTTSTTTTSIPGTTSPTTTTTVTTVPCTHDCFTLDFTNLAAGDTCGTARDSSDAVLKSLTCGGLNIGGGFSTVAEGPTPDGSTNRFSLNCAGSTCTIGPTTEVPAVNTAEPDCTTVGCNFGTPLPIANSGTSSCVMNTWTAPASGTIDVSTGASSTNVKLASFTSLTGNAIQPCPVCKSGGGSGPAVSGSPSSPATGTCDAGPRAGMTCTTTNSQGLTRDCPTGGTDPCPPSPRLVPGEHPCTPGQNCCDGFLVGTLSVDLSPLSTGPSSKQNDGGSFCDGQVTAGCFGSATCTRITENGKPAGPVPLGVPTNATLASVFCIPASGSFLIDAAADLPGPGAVSLPGQFVMTTATTTPLGSTTSTTIATTTIPSTSSTTTTSTTTTSTTTLNLCGNGVKDDGEECDGSAFGGFVCPSPGHTLLCTGDCTIDFSDCPEATTTTTTSSTTTTTISTLDFTLKSVVKNCGDTRNAANGVLKNLACGSLSIGGGGSTVPAGLTPDGSVSRFSLTCTGSNCTIGANSTVPAVNTPGPDCTNTNCNFGTPLPIVNSRLSTCVQNTWSAPASGTLDLTTGASSTSVPLTSAVFLTGNAAQPCPVCRSGGVPVNGSPASPATGTCDRGPRATQACTSTNSHGVTRDCPSGGADATHPCTVNNACIDGTFAGTIAVDLSPLSTGPANKTFANGLFCPNQTSVGCFGNTTCVNITENGAAAGAISPGVPKDATLASVFCIPVTGNGAINAASALPGPGAVSLPGTFEIH